MMPVLVVLTPFVAAAAGLVVGRHRLLAQRVAVIGTAIALALSVGMGALVWAGGPSLDEWGTVPTGWVPVTIATRADGLGATLAIMVTAIALCVQIYSTAYMLREPRYGTFAALVSLFTAAMLLVVLADDLIVLLVGWEVMGICSALLIGHHWEREEARSASVKAFVVTRLGDVGLLAGILVMADLTGSFRISELQESATPSTALTVGLVLMLCGVVGKSAQVPLHVWLPDAMAGPTPVSALIHAATMVAAGVFLVARLHSVYLLSSVALAVLALVAAATMLLAALAALAQDDYKRVLAWSTSSQLAYMLGALAVGGYSAGLFHLLAHGAFKALLFLAAGAIAHAVGTTMLSDMGGLRRSMPMTYLVSSLGLAALVGVPPLVGFFSKESVLGAAEQAALHGGPLPVWAAWLVLLAGLATVLLTAAYATRAWLLAFRGPPRRAGSAHDPPPAMRTPLVALAVPTVALGVLIVMPSVVSAMFDPGDPVAAEPEGLSVSPGTAVVSLALVGVAALAVLAEWRRVGRRDPALGLGPARGLLAEGLGVDRIYDVVVVHPFRVLSRLVVLTDRDVIHAYVRGAGRSARALGVLPHAAQGGHVQGYVTAVLAFVVILAAAGAGAVLL
ncbi:MAG TPA: NADH-quinone oxidoreductase subunit L [Jiangellaceae bacterium]|nr:NADH-quinone oxidoreductase subunit L [Jiangellaceae bacterium]